MSTVTANLTMSLDGFVADPDDGVGDLFGWYEDGPVEVRAFSGHTFHLSAPSAAVFADALASVGAYVMGRRLYDYTNGWNGRPPSDAPIVVLTHDAPDDPPRDGVDITFADSPERAVAEASALAGDRVVAVAGAATARACLDAGLLDEIVVNLVPVVLGEGIPFLAGIAGGPVRLADPEITAAPGVTHLRYRVLH